MGHRQRPGQYVRLLRLCCMCHSYDSLANVRVTIVVRVTIFCSPLALTQSQC